MMVFGFFFFVFRPSFSLVAVFFVGVTSESLSREGKWSCRSLQALSLVLQTKKERNEERSKDGEEECLQGSATSQALLQRASLLAAETVRPS